MTAPRSRRVLSVAAAAAAGAQALTLTVRVAVAQQPAATPPSEGPARPAPSAQSALPRAAHASDTTTHALMPPRMSVPPSVPYPQGAQGEATVVLVVTVGADGSVRSAAPVEPNEPFSGDAARAALDWRFEPATRDGRPVAARIKVEVVFRPPSSRSRRERVPNRDHAHDLPTSGEPSVGTGASGASGASGAPTPPVQGDREQPPGAPEEVLVRGAHEEPSRTATLSRGEVRQIPACSGTRSARSRSCRA